MSGHHGRDGVVVHQPRPWQPGEKREERPEVLTTVIHGKALVTPVTGSLAAPMFRFSKIKSVKPIRCYSTPEQVPIWYNIMPITRIKCDVRNLIRLIRIYAWIATIFKGKTYFIRNMYVYVLLYAISIYYIYVLCVCESCWYVYTCIHALSMIHGYFVLVFVCCYVYDMLIVVLILQLFILLLLRKTGASVIVQVRSDAGWVIVRCRILNSTNELSDPNCLWVLVGWPWPGGETT